MSERRSRRMLVVDDESIVGMRLAQVFGKAGFLVTVHTDPFLAVAEAQRQGFDVVIVDLDITGMDGNELLRRLGEANPQARLVAMSAAGGGREAAGGRVAAVVDKPCSLEEIRAAVLMD